MAGMNIRDDVLNQVPKPKMTGRDVAYRALAAALGGPVDLTSLFMAPFGYDVKEPVGGSEWIGRQMRDVGLVSEARDPLTEFVASLAVPGPGSGSAIAHGAMGLPALAGVIKAKGGNWLTGSVEDAVKGLKRPSGYADFPAIQAAEASPTDLSINEFVDKQLTRYIKNQMATPEDPVRALAEKGVLHYEPAVTIDRRMRANTARLVAERPDEMATSPMAKDWEDLTDASVYQRTAGQVADQNAAAVGNMEKEPWASFLPRDTPVYDFPQAGRHAVADLGFDHLIDELYNAARSGSDLPKSLQLKPESIKRMGVPQAVEHVAKINKWRADQMAEANAKIAKNPATHMFKEYPVVPGTGAPNDKGLHWVELKQPEFKPYTIETLPSRYRMAQELNPRNGKMIYGVIDDEAVSMGDFSGDPGLSSEEAIANFNKWASRNLNKKPVEEALKYEGDTMGHCVGGYCDEVLSGNTKIYSLRDAKGEPHVTVEVRPDPNTSYSRWLDALDHSNPADVDLYRKAVADRAGNDFVKWAAENDVVVPEAPSSIVQIKGKQNKAPKDEYLPFVQDFVRSGKWSDVGDLKNTGLLEASPARYTQPEGAGSGWMPRFDELDIEPGYYTNQELVDAIQRARAKQR